LLGAGQKTLRWQQRTHAIQQRTSHTCNVDENAQTRSISLYSYKPFVLNRGMPKGLSLRCWLALLLFAFLSSAQVFAAESKIIADGASLQKIWTEGSFTEGPACDDKGNVFFTDQPNDRILKVGLDGNISELCIRAFAK